MSGGPSLRSSFRTASGSCGIVPSEQISPFGSATAADRRSVDVKTDESCTLHGDRLLSHVALRYALVNPSRSVIYGLRL